jgi:hypothetical protein
MVRAATVSPSSRSIRSLVAPVASRFNCSIAPLENTAGNCKHHVGAKRRSSVTMRSLPGL